jgi:hypothetical protein
VVTINAGEEFYFDTKTAVEVIADGPILVTQFQSGPAKGTLGDPVMMLVQPESRFKNAFTIRHPLLGSAPFRGQNDFNTITIVAQVGNANSGSVLIDGVAVPPARFKQITDSNYAYAIIEYRPPLFGGTPLLDPTDYFIEAPDPIGVYVNGYHHHDAYGYFGQL